MACPEKNASHPKPLPALARLVVTLLSLAYVTAGEADEKPAQLSVATWNLEWFFDENTQDNYGQLPKQQSAPNRQQWQWKRDGVARAIAAMKPAILALQEVENRQVLWFLTRRLRDEHDLNYRIAFVEGGDYFTEQDVAILYQSGLVQYGRREQTREMFQSGQYYNVQKHLFARFQWGRGNDRETLVVVNLHLRASPGRGNLRQRQARLIRYWIDQLDPASQNIVVLGDLNTEETTPARPASDVGILCGLGRPRRADQLIDLHSYLEAAQRATHLNGKQFDRILISQPLRHDAPGKRDLVFTSVRSRKDLVVQGQQDRDHRDSYYTIPQAERDLSDHYPVIATFQFR